MEHFMTIELNLIELLNKQSSQQEHALAVVLLQFQFEMLKFNKARI